MILRSTRRRNTVTPALSESIKKEEPISPVQGPESTVVMVMKESVSQINFVEPKKEKLSPATPIVKPEEKIKRRNKRPANLAIQDSDTSQSQNDESSEFRTVLENVIKDILRSTQNQPNIKNKKKRPRNEVRMEIMGEVEVIKLDDDDDDCSEIEEVEVIQKLPTEKTEKKEVIKIEKRSTRAEKIIKIEKKVIPIPVIITDYTFDWNSDPEKIFLFAGSRPNLENLVIPNLAKIRHSSFSEDEPKIIEALNMILWSSKDSLKSLELYPLGPFVQVKLPKLKNLNQLTLLPQQLSATGPMFPSFPALNWQRTFPRLKKFNFNLNLYSEEEMEDFFPSTMTYDYTAVVTAVETLQIAHPDRMVRPGFFQKLFPNVRKLVLGINNFMLTLGCSWDTIWTLYPDLVDLDLILPMSLCVSKIHKLSLDSKLTSIPLHACPHVLREVSSSFDQEPSDTWQRDMPPSLRSLMKLRRLKIVVANDDDDDDGSVNWNNKNFRLISLVSCVYAFKLMPDLIVIVVFDHNLISAPYIAGNLMAVSNFIKLQHTEEKYENYFPKYIN